MQEFIRNILTCSDTFQEMMQLIASIQKSHPWRKLTKFYLSIRPTTSTQILCLMLTRIHRSKKKILLMKATWSCCRPRSTLKLKTRLQAPLLKTRRPPKLVLLLRVQPTVSHSRSSLFTFCPIIDKKEEKICID